MYRVFSTSKFDVICLLLLVKCFLESSVKTFLINFVQPWPFQQEPY